MKILMIFDQVQAGLGGKENGNVGLGGKKMAIGSASMFENYLKDYDAKIFATLYCGDDYYLENSEIVMKKMAAMTQKLQPDVVICGPAFNYEKYGQMCVEVGHEIESKLQIPVVAAMSKECEKAIAEHKDDVDIVQMPKKGGTGLVEALKRILELSQMKVAGDDISEFKEKYCY